MPRRRPRNPGPATGVAGKTRNVPGGLDGLPDAFRVQVSARTANVGSQWLAP